MLKKLVYKNIKSIRRHAQAHPCAGMPTWTSMMVICDNPQKVERNGLAEANSVTFCFRH